ncbi:hypothetical protein ACMYUM_30680 (plasmid) [Priestia megaterium]|jgi:HKD family nuclease|uniref:Uncharacterized protein n=1 Tax=Priestia megaterium TaxID=1404 RepID=A0AAX6BTF2_PRIMG|nr:MULTISPECIES: hypothetical protein [Priestia]MDN4634327.1 hypothetical protein [Sphingomonas sp. PsM26]HES8074082.1 hypothetical protein [Streptococcus pyogenes]MBU8757583.1 hypothetical protein [Priestia megaterium]MBY0201468.1 hypothetical protein [Priestia megaterium]MCU7713213.1 hypothetical protein [Priestia megaterium]
MEKHKIKQILQEHELFDIEIPFMTKDGVDFVRVDLLVHAIIKMKGRVFKDIYRAILQNKNNPEALYCILREFAEIVDDLGYAFKK